MRVEGKDVLGKISKNKQELRLLKKAYRRTERDSKRIISQIEAFGKKAGTTREYHEFTRIAKSQKMWEESLVKRILEADHHLTFLEKELASLSKKQARVF